MSSPDVIDLKNESGTTVFYVDANGNLVVTGSLTGSSGAAYQAGGTDVAVADGGTGASTAAGARTNLGLGSSDSPTFAGGTFTGTLNLNDGSLLQRLGSGNGTGDVIEVLGPDSTHGMKTVVFEDTVSPNAVETTLFTLPANSVIDCVQANCEAALTGGGTTVTWGIGITGDVDKWGTVFAAGAQSNSLAKNSKINAIGIPASPPQPGSGIGEFQASAVAVKLIAAASGGTTAGNTALTVGSVKVRVVYRTAMSLADAP